MHSRMQLLESLMTYPGRTIVKTAGESFSRHFYYFSEIFVVLSFFDDRIVSYVRTQMVSNLQIPVSDES